MTVNGESRAFRDGLTLLELLDEVKIDARAAAVMVGEEVYRPGRIPDVALKESDVIEIVSMMQGG
jgi:thiamine biosynthesis protein ThiS